MDFITAIQLILLIVVSIQFSEQISYFIMTKFRTPPPQPAGPEKLNDLLNNVNMIIDLEFIFCVELPRSTKEIDLISDFNAVRDTMVKNIMKYFTNGFFLRCNMLGIKREFLIVYVTRKTEARIIDYMRENNLALK